MTELDTSNAGAAIRFLLRRAVRGYLGTLLSPGAPYVSLVEMATDGGGSPVLLLSGLAQHSRNLRAADVASLLIDGTGETLDGPRATLVGSVMPLDDEDARRRYLARHPHAQAYAGFADFSYHRFVVDRAHLVAGFGRIEWAPAEEILLAETEWRALAAAEAGIVAHMNADHADAIALYATVLLGAPKGAWRMTGIDPEGVDITDGYNGLRLTFDTVVRSSGEARAALVELVRRARAASPA